MPTVQWILLMPRWWSAAEALERRKIFTIDRNDFAAYRVRRGHRHYAFEVLG